MDSVTITLTTAGSATGPFDLYSNLDGYTTAFETSVSKSSLVAGYLSTVVPTGTSTIRVTSTGACTNYIDIPVTGITTSTTTSTTTSPPTTTTTSTTTSTTTATMVSLGVNGKKSSGAGGTLYMWYSTDGGTTWTILNGGTNSGVLNTTCTPLGTTASYPLGTVFTIMMSDISGPALSTNYSVNVSEGGSCPGTVSDCTHNTATPVAGGVLTIWSTGNIATSC